MLFICDTSFSPEAAANVFNSIYQSDVVYDIVVKDKTYVWVLRDIVVNPKVFARYGIYISNLDKTTCRAKF